MDFNLWDKPQPLQREARDHRRRLRRENPSFSSSLLDAIYRSIDESNGQGEEPQLILYRETTMTKQSIAAARTEDADEALKFRRVEKWMEMKKKKVGSNVRDFTNSSSSSSESSCTAGRFSSSESEFLSRPKPIKTTTEIPKPKPKHENGFLKTKSKASKMYHDLKKVKQPISPGARLANFLNSLFNGGTPKTKQKLSNSSVQSSKSLQGSTCSSTSSFSRSCLSKTPSSRGNAAKRSVRFCPVSVIVDEDCRPCGHKILHKIEPILKKPLKTEQVKTEHDFEDDDEDYDDEDDDGLSCSSSDLFELDNLSVIGIERYREELPVYETTNFKTNCAIANGLVL
ncbi:protein BIG GRAIN 1-like B [Momordica charantia]|uniref:Protein BIG GRAIN 1-like B n=1 Tax=Momordica charantia TaxID=3673 RepID=A0A6J1DIF0_MOMCH|nr:protein BIG GRAIN 1-like B [Momordica charantia]